MPWVWTDELAARLIDAGLVDERQVAEWTMHPLAFRIIEADDER